MAALLASRVQVDLVTISSTDTCVSPVTYSHYLHDMICYLKIVSIGLNGCCAISFMLSLMWVLLLFEVIVSLIFSRSFLVDAMCIDEMVTREVIWFMI